jgi:GrpB-like predicted nucleotidyltransferase (UPF0157 family)
MGDRVPPTLRTPGWCWEKVATAATTTVSCSPTAPLACEGVLVSTRPQIVDYDPSWPSEFEVVATRARTALGDVTRSIEHIGSTAVPGLAAKDVIDVMAVVGNDSDLIRAADALAASGWSVDPAPSVDHPVPGLGGDPREWTKRFATEPAGIRRTNLHVRIAGRANHRYALLFRDFLMAHPTQAASYAEAKRRLARLCDSTRPYAEAKDPICDLIYLSAENWAEATGWQPPVAGS